MGLKAQKLNYSVLLDNPQEVKPKLALELFLFQFDMKLQGNDGFPLRSGLRYSQHILPNLAIQTTATVAWKNAMPRKNVNHNWLGLPIDITLGAERRLGHNNLRKSIKVTLRKTEYKFNDGAKITETDYIYCQGHMVRNLYARAGMGFYSQSNSIRRYVRVNNFSKISSDPMNIDSAQTLWSNNTYTYVGLNLEKIINLNVNVEKFGKRKVGIARETIFDIIIATNQKFKVQDMMPNVNVNFRGNVVDKSKIENAFGKKSPLGWRLLIREHNVGTPKKSSNMSSTLWMEFGNRPYTGWYWNIGTNLFLFQKKS